MQIQITCIGLIDKVIEIYNDSKEIRHNWRTMISYDDGLSHVWNMLLPNVFISHLGQMILWNPLNHDSTSNTISPNNISNTPKTHFYIPHSSYQQSPYSAIKPMVTG